MELQRDAQSGETKDATRQGKEPSHRGESQEQELETSEQEQEHRWPWHVVRVVGAMKEPEASRRWRPRLCAHPRLPADSNLRVLDPL